MIYRVQCKNTGVGPYRTKDENSSLIIPVDNPLRETSPKHPTPEGEFAQLLVNCSDHLIFGFDCMTKLEKWFGIPEFDHIWKYCHVVAYDKEVHYSDGVQCVFYNV